MEKYLVVSGAAIFGILGAIHLFYTFFTDRFDARDPAVKVAMQNTAPILTKDTSMWNAWIGFNASHSLGAIFIAAIYIPLALSHFELIRTSLWFTVLPIVIGLSYLVLAKKYWFNIPFIGILVATLLFFIAAFSIHI